MLVACVAGTSTLCSGALVCSRSNADLAATVNQTNLHVAHMCSSSSNCVWRRHFPMHSWPGCPAQAKNILIAVGGKPTKLPIPGAELCITSDEALELPAQPKKITVLGGGYIALEFSGIFQRFGGEVHTVFRQPMPLRGFDEEVRACCWWLWCCCCWWRPTEEGYLRHDGGHTCCKRGSPCLVHGMQQVKPYVLLPLQVRKFAFEQYAAAGLTMHAGHTPVEVRKQPNGLLTCVVADKDGNQTEITDNDHVSAAASCPCYLVLCCGWVHCTCQK